jgi:hypothetical protein
MVPRKEIDMIKQRLSSSLFDWKEFIEYNSSHDVFVNKKASNSRLDWTFEVTDSTKDTLKKEAACGPLLLILIKVVIVKVSEIVYIQSIITVMNEKGNEKAAGVMNIQTTTAVDMQLSKKGTLYREIEVFKPVVGG